MIHKHVRIAWLLSATALLFTTVDRPARRKSKLSRRIKTTLLRDRAF